MQISKTEFVKTIMQGLKARKYKRNATNNQYNSDFYGFKGNVLRNVSHRKRKFKEL